MSKMPFIMSGREAAAEKVWKVGAQITTQVIKNTSLKCIIASINVQNALYNAWKLSLEPERKINIFKCDNGKDRTEYVWVWERRRNRLRYDDARVERVEKRLL